MNWVGLLCALISMAGAVSSTVSAWNSQTYSERGRVAAEKAKQTKTLAKEKKVWL